MPASIFPSYPPSISFEQSSYLLKSFIDWSLFNGLSVRPLQAENQNGALAVHAPVTLFPSPFPRACFEEAKAVQIWFNELYARIAADEEWLLKIVDEYVVPFALLIDSYGRFTLKLSRKIRHWE